MALVRTGTALEFCGQCIRTRGTPDTPWFCLSDVCAILGMTRARDKARSVPDDYKTLFDMPTAGGVQGMHFVNEGGLFYVIMTTRSPVVEDFRRWVCDTVLPSIRRTGSYTQGGGLKPRPLRLEDDPQLAQRAVESARGVLREHPNDARLVLAATELLHRSMTAITGRKRSHDEVSAGLFTVSQLLETRYPASEVHSHRIAVGRKVAREYRRRLGRNPRRTMQNVGGRPCNVCAYTDDECEAWVIEYACACMDRMCPHSVGLRARHQLGHACGRRALQQPPQG